MAKKLDNTQVRMGYLIRVSNEKKKPSAKSFYYALKLENRTDAEFWVLLTSKEVQRLKPCQLDDGLQAHKPGHLYYRHRVGKTWRSFLFVVMPNPDHDSKEPGPTYCVTVSDKQLVRFAKRAAKNKEDIPVMNWVQDFMD